LPWPCGGDLASPLLCCKQWTALTFYQRFESVVAFALTLIISLVIVVALYRLISEVIGGLVFGALKGFHFLERGGQEAKNQYDSRAKPNQSDWRSPCPPQHGMIA
jgi:hypothetical protein